MPRAFGSLVLLALIGACGTPPSTSDGNELPPGSNVDIGEPIAEVNGFPIGSREFEAAAARVAPANGTAFTDEEKQEILDDLITEKMLYLHARSLGVDRDPKVQKVMVNTLLRERVYSEVRSTDFTDDELRAYFDEHSDEFVVPEKLQVRRILIRVDQSRSQEDAQALAEDLHARIVEDPSRFESLAAEHSEDPYRRRGGDLGFMSRDGKPGVDDAVTDKAFEMDVGDVSEPFEAGGGLNIIMVESRREQVSRTFAQMKGSVLRKVKAQRYRELYEAYVDGIDDDFTVSVDESAMGEITLRPGRGPRFGGRPGILATPGMDDDDADEGMDELE